MGSGARSCTALGAVSMMPAPAVASAGAALLVPRESPNADTRRRNLKYSPASAAARTPKPAAIGTDVEYPALKGTGGDSAKRGDSVTGGDSATRGDSAARGAAAA